MRDPSNHLIAVGIHRGYLVTISSTGGVNVADLLLLRFALVLAVLPIVVTSWRRDELKSYHISQQLLQSLLT